MRVSPTSEIAAALRQSLQKTAAMFFPANKAATAGRRQRKRIALAIGIRGRRRSRGPCWARFFCR